MNQNASVEINSPYVRKVKSTNPTAALGLPPYVPTPEYVAPKAEKPKVTEGDLKILKFILEMRYLDQLGIEKQFFTDANRESEKHCSKAEAIVTALVEAKLLKAKVLSQSKQVLYLVTEEGRSELEKAFPEVKLPQVTKQVFEPRVRHDLMLSDLRSRFEELHFVRKWFSEPMLKEVPLFLREFQDMPDAVCRKMNEKAYFLELEVSRKSGKAYRERIDLYLEILKMPEMKEAQIEGVIFFCKHEEVRNAILAQIPIGARGVSVVRYDAYFMNKKEQQNEEAS